jgi:hypothetical protein
VVVDARAPVSVLGGQVQEAFGLEGGTVTFYYEDSLLDDEMRIRDLELPDDGVIDVRVKDARRRTATGPGVAKPAVKPAGPVKYNFFLPTVDSAREDQRFVVELPGAAIVLDAKAAIARQLGVVADDVSLLFLGKLLQDGFVMGGLRIGEKEVVVTVDAMDDFFIETARGMKAL